MRLGDKYAFHDDTFICDALGKSYLTYKAEVTVNLTLSHYNNEWDYENGKVNSSRNYLKQKIVLFTKVPVYSETPKLIIQSLISTIYEFKPESDLIVEIHRPPNKAGVITLTGSEMDPMIQPVTIGPDGSARIAFIHTFRGEITVSVKVGEDTAERKLTIG